MQSRPLMVDDKSKSERPEEGTGEKNDPVNNMQNSQQNKIVEKTCKNNPNITYKCQEGSDECTKMSEMYCDMQKITCEDGSERYCKAGSQGCVTNSETYCPSLTFQCNDVPTSCMKGSEGCDMANLCFLASRGEKSASASARTPRVESARMLPPQPFKSAPGSGIVPMSIEKGDLTTNWP